VAFLVRVVLLNAKIVNRVAVGFTDLTDRCPAGVSYCGLIQVRKPDQVLKYGIFTNLLSQILNVIPKTSYLSSYLVGKCQ
jgi:hypothetical protein